MFIKILPFIGLVFTGCSINSTYVSTDDAYYALENLEEQHRMPINIFFDQIVETFPELDVKISEDGKTVRLNPVSAEESYEFNPNQHWLDIGLYRASEGNDWGKVAVFSRYPNDFNASKNESLKYCKEILNLANENFNIVLDDINAKFEKKIKETGFYGNFKTIGHNYSVYYDGKTFDKGDPFLCVVEQN